MDNVNYPNMGVGYAFVTPQIFTTLLSLDEGYRKGTIFPELDLPLGVYEKDWGGLV